MNIGSCYPDDVEQFKYWCVYLYLRHKCTAVWLNAQKYGNVEIVIGEFEPF